MGYRPQLLEGDVGLRRRIRRLAAVCLLVGCGPGFAVFAADRPSPPRPVEDFYLYRPVSAVRFTDTHGRQHQLSQAWQRRPLLVALVFARCAEICPPFLRSFAEAVKTVGGAGRDFDVLVLSFDPSDTARDMAAVAERHGLADAAGWTFGVTSAAEARSLARSVGFWIRWDPERELYDHPAMLAAVDRGRVVRLLVGATVPARRLREAVWELRHDLVSTYPLPSEKVLFRCFGYDPRTGGVTLEWGLLLLLAPGLFTVVCAAWIFRGGRRERARYGL
jgi:protein SCO1